MPDIDPSAVTPVVDARAGLSKILQRFRSDPDALPVTLGSHRKPEAVILPVGRYRRLLSDQAPVIRLSVLDDIRHRQDLIRRIATLNKMGDVAVFGSVARGEETPTSDVDSLVTFSRAGFTGSQAHGAFWAGDENSTWEAFRWSMLAGLSAASSGILYWGWDIAGFSGPPPTAELYLRAMAASVFTPIMQYHSEFNHHKTPSNDRTPWNIAALTGDPRVLPVSRELVKLRERLVPYLAEQAALTVRTSRPLMRPLYFDHPYDEEVWRHPIQWMLGDDVLVAPVLEAGATTWHVYLPAGEWVQAWTGAASTGPSSVTIDVPIDRIPVFLRASARERLGGVFRD